MLYDKVSRAGTDFDLLHQVVHGPASGAGSVVQTEAGTVPTAARLMADKGAEFDADAAEFIAGKESAILDIAVNVSSGVASSVLADVPSPPLPDIDVPWGICDENGQPILGVKASGVAIVVTDELPGIDLLSHEFRYVEVDDLKRPLFGVRWDGTIFGNGLMSASTPAWVQYGDVWAMSDSVPVQVTSGVEVAVPISNGAFVQCVVRQAGGYASSTIAVPSPGNWAPFVAEVLHVVSHGQSLSMGQSATVFTTNPPCANRLRTLAAGVRLANQDDILTSAACTPLQPLVASTQEAPVVQHVAQLQRIGGLPVASGVVASAHGRGGKAIAELAKGTSFYSNAMTAVSAVRADVVASGRSYRVPYLDWIHGESDRSAATGVYMVSILQLQADFEADIKAITGQAGKIPILCDQISNWTAYGQTVCAVPLDQVQAALQYPDRIVCAGPKYWVATVADGIHLPSLSSRRIGAMHARAAEAILAGQRWYPTHCYKAALSGNVVTLWFYTPIGRLMVDTVNVSDPGNLGIRYSDSSGSAAVSSVAVNLDNTVTVTLSAIPAGANKFIGIADIGVAGAAGGPTTGPRACLRDSSTDRCGDGLPLWNWAVHQRISIT